MCPTVYVKYLGDKVPTISFTEKFIDSVPFSSRDVSSKSWESIGYFSVIQRINFETILIDINDLKQCW